MPVTPELSTNRLRLEPLRVEHADEMVEVLAPRALYEYYPDEPSPTLEALRETYRRQTRGHSSDGRQTWNNWIIRLISSGEAIGFIQVTTVDSEAEMAWVVGVPWQGNGYAAEAARAVRDSCLAGDTQQYVAAVICHIAPDHEKSERIARSLGMSPTTRRHEGERRWETSPS